MLKTADFQLSGSKLEKRMNRKQSSCLLSCTHLDTREKASAQTAGHGTSLIITCSLAAWKWTLVTFSSTEVSVATSLLFVLGSPPAVSRMFPPCTTSSSTRVLHFFCTEKKKSCSRTSTTPNPHRGKFKRQKKFVGAEGRDYSDLPR